jgi:hypothetical protein
MKGFAAAALTVALCGCAYPQSSIGQGSEMGRVRASGPNGADIRVDGVESGAIGPSGRIVIDVTPGKRHLLEQQGGRTIAEGDFEIGAGSTVNFGAGLENH